MSGTEVTGRARAGATPEELAVLLRRIARLGLAVIAAWVLLNVAWAVWAPISGAVVASGIVKVDTNRQTVSHRDGGIVAEIRVREGDAVEAGQPLIVLEDVRIDASNDLLQAQLASEQIRRARLEAEARHGAGWEVPGPITAGPADRRLREVIERERAAFAARRRTLDSQMELLRRQIADARAEIVAREREQQSGAEALALMREEIAANEKLTGQGYVNRTRVLGLRRAAAEYETRIEDSRAELARAQQKISELETRIVGLRDSYVQTASDELRDLTARIIDLEQRMRASRDATERKVVVAPVDGRLLDLRVNTVGSAIGPREPIVDIVPLDAPLVVEAQVGSAAISDVAVDMQAEVRLLPYRYRTTKLLIGRVIHVSADALADPRTGVPYYVARVEVPRAELEAAGDLALLPGMPAEVFIKSAERTPLTFLLDPLVAAIRVGFREH